MLDNEQQLNEAAARYLELLEADQPVADEAIASDTMQLREAVARYQVNASSDELAPFLEDVLLADMADEPGPLTTEETDMAARVTARLRGRVRGQ